MNPENIVNFYYRAKEKKDKINLKKVKKENVKINNFGIKLLTDKIRLVIAQNEISNMNNCV